MGKIKGYMVICHYKAGDHMAQVRNDVLSEHMAHIERTVDQILLGGPLFEGDNPAASFLLLKADSEAEALEMAKQDPYYAAGIWDRFTVRRFVGGAGTLLGGITW
jgi:hypothetical protein